MSQGTVNPVGKFVYDEITSKLYTDNKKFFDENNRLLLGALDTAICKMVNRALLKFSNNKEDSKNSSLPPTNIARDAICVNEKCFWNLKGVCGQVKCCPGRNK